MIAQWFRDRDRHLEWDKIVFVQRDMLLFEAAEELSLMLKQDEILLSGLQPVAEFEKVWQRISPKIPEHRQPHFKFLAHVPKICEYRRSPAWWMHKSPVFWVKKSARLVWSSLHLRLNQNPLHSARPELSVLLIGHHFSTEIGARVFRASKQLFPTRKQQFIRTPFNGFAKNLNWLGKKYLPNLLSKIHIS